MMYGTSPFTYGKKLPTQPRYHTGQLVGTNQGNGRVRASRFNGTGWEYGLEIVGLTKGGSIWFTENAITGYVS